ncbi:MAG: DUF2236 domain-containing protein [Acidobacteria bacterium]|nr:DUF2236 domain-containing protein [Acidobacteriota bacterium]
MDSSRWNNEMLNAMREVTDPLADDAVCQIYERDDLAPVNNLLHELVTNDQIIPERLPRPIQDYLEATRERPQWTDDEKIKLAEDFFERHGLFICSSLFFASLPSCYACAKGVKVLYLTGKLETNPTRRIAETAQLILDTLMPGGLAPDGKGVRDAQKVRLLHAAIRHLILHDQRWNKEWNSDWGKPINQEDLGGTLLSFSKLPLDCLAQLGVKISADEAEAYNHAWNIVGHMMGVLPEMRAATTDEAQELVNLILQRNVANCPEGEAMTAALLETLGQNSRFKLVQEVPHTLVRYFSGDQVADALNLPKHDAPSILIGALRKIVDLFETEEHHSQVFTRIAEYFSRDFLETMTWIQRGGQRAPFAIPAKLSDHWKLHPHPGTAQ